MWFVNTDENNLRFVNIDENMLWFINIDQSSGFLTQVRTICGLLTQIRALWFVYIDENKMWFITIDESSVVPAEHIPGISFRLIREVVMWLQDIRIVMSTQFTFLAMIGHKFCADLLLLFLCLSPFPLVKDYNVNLICDGLFSQFSARNSFDECQIVHLLYWVFLSVSTEQSSFYQTVTFLTHGCTLLFYEEEFRSKTGAQFTQS